MYNLYVGQDVNTSYPRQKQNPNCVFYVTEIKGLLGFSDGDPYQNLDGLFFLPVFANLNPPNGSKIEVSTEPFKCLWSNTQIGRVAYESVNNNISEKAKRVYLEHEVSLLNQWLQGKSYFFSIEDQSDEKIVQSGFSSLVTASSALMEVFARQVRDDNLSYPTIKSKSGKLWL